jgi:predicted ester cyclase|tara:strand:- start:222 stop:650 length:429 start_codon:yes stop_codon:yes gene_type:complete
MGLSNRIGGDMTDSNADIAARALGEILGNGNLDVVNELYAPEYIHHGPGGDSDREGFRAAEAGFAAAVSDANFVVDDLFESGDRVAIRWTLTANQTGEVAGIAPTGKQFSIAGIMIFRIENNMIVEDWEEVNLSGLLALAGS